MNNRFIIGYNYWSSEDGRFMLIISNPNDWTLTDTLTLKDGLKMVDTTNANCVKGEENGKLYIELKSGDAAIVFLK